MRVRLATRIWRIAYLLTSILHLNWHPFLSNLQRQVYYKGDIFYLVPTREQVFYIKGQESVEIHFEEDK